MSDYQGLVTKWRGSIADGCMCEYCETTTTHADELAEVIARNVQPSPDYPRPCGICDGVIQSKDDLDWHGYGNCREIPDAVLEACNSEAVQLVRDVQGHVAGELGERIDKFLERLAEARSVQQPAPNKFASGREPVESEQNKTARASETGFEYSSPSLRNEPLAINVQQPATDAGQSPTSEPKPRRMMRVPKNPAYPNFNELHFEDAWCVKSRCTYVGDFPPETRPASEARPVQPFKFPHGTDQEPWYNPETGYVEDPHWRDRAEARVQQPVTEPELAAELAEIATAYHVNRWDKHRDTYLAGLTRKFVEALALRDVPQGQDVPWKPGTDGWTIDTEYLKQVGANLKGLTQDVLSWEEIEAVLLAARQVPGSSEKEK